jgi:hypothetical protein
VVSWSTRARKSAVGRVCQPGWWKIASSSIKGASSRAAKRRASVDLPDPELPTTDTRCTNQQSNSPRSKIGREARARPPPHAVVQVAFLEPANLTELLQALRLSTEVAMVGFAIAILIGAALARLALVAASGRELRFVELHEEGPTTAAGQDELRGALLAAEIINETSRTVPLPLASTAGLPNLGGAKIRLIRSDTMGDPARASEERARPDAAGRGNTRPSLSAAGGPASAASSRRPNLRSASPSIQSR